VPSVGGAAPVRTGMWGRKENSVGPMGEKNEKSILRGTYVFVISITRLVMQTGRTIVLTGKIHLYQCFKLLSH
jgi:hypothetical protein